MDNDKPERIYLFNNKEEEKKKLLEQFAWADSEMNKYTKAGFRSDYKIMCRQEIHKYIRNIDFTGFRVIGKCVVLDNSTKFESKVLICPLVNESQVKDGMGLNLGIIPSIDPFKETYALIQDIKMISKRHFNFEEEPKVDGSNESKIGAVTQKQCLMILETRMSFIRSIIRRSQSLYNEHSIFHNAQSITSCWFV